MQVSPYDDGRIVMPYYDSLCFLSNNSVPTTSQIIQELKYRGYRLQPYYYRIVRVHFCPVHKKYVICITIHYRLK